MADTFAAMELNSCITTCIGLYTECCSLRSHSASEASSPCSRSSRKTIFSSSYALRCADGGGGWRPARSACNSSVCGDVYAEASAKASSSSISSSVQQVDDPMKGSGCCAGHLCLPTHPPRMQIHDSGRSAMPSPGPDEDPSCDPSALMPVARYAVRACSERPCIPSPSVCVRPGMSRQHRSWSHRISGMMLTVAAAAVAAVAAD